jgi:hypothetical protein
MLKVQMDAPKESNLLNFHGVLQFFIKKWICFQGPKMYKP